MNKITLKKSFFILMLFLISIFSYGQVKTTAYLYTSDHWGKNFEDFLIILVGKKWKSLLELIG